MKKCLATLLAFIALALIFGSPVLASSTIYYSISTDLIEIFDEEYQAELMYVTSNRSAFSFRLGSYRGLEDTRNVYAENKRHWELGGRWRNFLIDSAPRLLFVGLGFDNRPQDSTITPLGELGFNLVFKPVLVSVLVFGGYEIDVNETDANRWVKGVELRVGLGF